MEKTLILTGWSNSLHVGSGHHAEALEGKGGNQAAEAQGQLEI